MNLKNQKLFQAKSYINGQWISSDKTVAVTNPATGEEIAQVADLGVNEAKEAIEAADRAFPAWRDKPAKERAKILHRWYELVMEHQEDLAHIMTREQGKPLTESAGEIAYAASYIEWFAEEAKRAYGETIPTFRDGARVLTIRQPVGVCATITPWNFPSAMLARKVAPALAAGCTVVSRPAAETPLSALALAVLAEEAGVPPGVFNIVTSSSASETGEEFCANETVRKLSFTGSTEVGRKLMKQSADTVKKLSLELGGNAPFIIFEDADIDAAVKGAVICKFRNAGQTCVCANRFYIHENVYDEFTDKFVGAVQELKVGNGLEEGVDIGPLINKDALDKVKRHIHNAVDNGAELLLGGQNHELGGSYFQPTVIGNATQDMDFASEETFGPVAPLFKFSDEQDVIAKANDTIFGLASYFYTRDIGRVWRVAEALEYGMVAVNDGKLSSEVVPFGGVKQSGIGREGSRHGLDEYTEIKYILMNL